MDSGQRDRLSLFYIFSVLVIATGGIPKGYDEGGFSASVTLKSFEQDYNLVKSHWKGNESGLANRTGNITSFGVLGAACGCILALLLDSRLSRLTAWRSYALLWASGLCVQNFSSGIYGLLLFGRIWGGLGAGGLTVVTPIYLSEVTPAHSRGWIVSLYMVFLLSFLSLGFFVNYASDKTLAATREQYRIVQSVPLIPVGISFCCSFFLVETPRYLITQDREAEAQDALARLRGKPVEDPSVIDDFGELQQQMKLKAIETQNYTTVDLLREIWTPRYRSRLLLSLAFQTFGQWSGGNGITYYIPQIFKYAGVRGNSDSLLSSGIYGIVKLVSTTAVAFVLLDRVGRRPFFLGGLVLQILTHVYMAAYMGYQPGSAENTNASNAAIAAVFIYAFGWSVGLCVVQSIYGTEIFPTRIRGLCYSIAMTVHWFFQFAVVKVTPTMFANLDIWGAYVIWACICFVGLIALGLWAPETAQVPIEKMDELFEGPWYKTWKAKPRDDEINLDADMEDKILSKVQVRHVE